MKRTEKQVAWHRTDRGKASIRRTNLLVRYGITEERYDELYAQQEGRCAICGVGGALSVDHNHETGVVRGLLCHACNTGLGGLKDSPELLLRAVEYLHDTDT